MTHDKSFAKIETLEPMILMSASLFGSDADDFLTTEENGQYLSGLGGDDVLIGAHSENDIYGGDGNDILMTNAGGNNLYGGDGDDTVVYEGQRSEFEIWIREDGSIMVQDAKRLDAIVDVEKFQFGSDIFSVDELFNLNSEDAPPQLVTSQHISVNSGSTFVADLMTFDPDGEDVSLLLTGLGDSGLFEIDDNGVLRFREPADLDSFPDKNGDNVYGVYLQLSDGNTAVHTPIWVSVLPDDGTNGGVNSAPEFVNLPADNLFETEEFFALEGGQFVTRLEIIDVNSDPLDVQIADVPDSDGHLFTIDQVGSTFLLSFRSRADFEAPQDQDGDNDYQIFVTASDGTTSTTQQLTVRVTNADSSPPVFVGLADGDLLRTESRQPLYFAAVDPDGRAIQFSLTGADANLWTISSVDAFTARLSLTTDLLSGFTSGPPLDTNQDGISELTLVAFDGEDVSYRSIMVETLAPTSENSAPEIHGLSSGDVITVSDGVRPVIDVDAVDTDGQALFYFLAGADGYLFQFDNNGDPALNTNGLLSFRSTPEASAPADADGDGIYDVRIIVSDGITAQNVDVQVNVVPFRDGENSAPEFVNLPFMGVSDQVRVGERNTMIIDLDAFDADGDELSFEIVGPDNFYQLDPATGVLSWSPGSYEILAISAGIGPGPDTSTDVTVRVTDGDAFTDVVVPIRIVNFDEFNNQTPVLTNVVDGQVFAIPDGQNSVLDVDATDGDAGQELFYTLTGRDAHLFKIDRETGELTTAAILSSTSPSDQDGNNRYELTVGVYDRLSFDMKDIVIEFATA